MNFVIGIVLVLGLMIMIHEWGHFIVARLFKVRVDVFSIGFGPRLFGWKRGATDWRISALPLGGYVRMAGQDLSEIDSNETAPTGAPDELMSKPRWQRALIAFAGPAVNLIFPILLLTGFFLFVGMPYFVYMDQPAQVAALPASAPANALQVGDKILSIGDIQNPTLGQASTAIRQAEPAGVIKVEVENAGVKRTVSLPLTKNPAEDEKRFLGYAPLPIMLDEIGPGTPAERAGLKEKDVIRSVNGQKMDYWGQFTEYVRASTGKPLNLEIDRKGQQIQATVTPQQGFDEAGEKIYQIGVSVVSPTKYRRAGLGEAFSNAWSFTQERVRETIGVVGKLVTGQVSVRQLQGAVGISRVAGEAVKRGPVAVISVMVLISVNLGILNLLPIPILDGGNILLLALEGIRRRDFSLAFKERFVQVGLVFLLVIFVYVMYNDIVRLFPIHS